MAIDEVFSDARVVALVGAAAQGDTEQVRSLVAEGVDPNATGVQGATPLMWACLQEGRGSVEALLAAGADPERPDEAGRTSIHMAAAADDPEPLDVLLERGADPDLPNPLNGRVPLVAAMMAERHEQFRRLLEAGADPDVVDDKGDTLLHIAGKINDTACILMLLDAGTDPTARNRQGLNFKQYLDMTSLDVLADEVRKQRSVIDAWLDEHGIQLESSSPPRSHRAARRSGTDTPLDDGDDGAWVPGGPDHWRSPSVGSRWDHGAGELDGPWG